MKYENGATTTYEYDPNTFRITRIRTTRSSDSAVLQDLNYWYDPVGNITIQEDAAQQAVYYYNTIAAPTNKYTYDALYRLIEAHGREHAGSNAPVSYNDSTRLGNVPLPSDASAMRRYRQFYTYDPVGNMTEMKHTTSGGTGNWTRSFNINIGTNRLSSSSIGSESYSYDLRGNMTNGMSHLLSMSYNEENRLEQVSVNSDITAYYQYDHGGQRVRKVVVDTGTSRKYIRKYIDIRELYHKIDTSVPNVMLARETLHVMDDQARVAMIDTPTIDVFGTGGVVADQF